MLTHKKFCGSTCIQLSVGNFLKIQFSSGREQFVEAPHANLAWSVIVNHGDGICRISSSPSATYHIFSLIKSIPKLSLYLSFLVLEVSHSYNSYSHHSVFSSIALFHLTQIWTPRSNYYHFYKRSQQSHTFQKRRKKSNSRALGYLHVSCFQIGLFLTQNCDFGAHIFLSNRPLFMQNCGFGAHLFFLNRQFSMQKREMMR